MKVSNQVIKIVLNDDISQEEAQELSEVIAVLIEFKGLVAVIFVEEEVEEVDDGEEE